MAVMRVWCEDVSDGVEVDWYIAVTLFVGDRPVPKARWVLGPGGEWMPVPSLLDLHDPGTG